MFGNVTLGRVAGIGVTVHWTFWILLAFWTLSGVGSGGLAGGAVSAAMLAALFGCVVLHELGHALTARAFGIGTKSITLTPLGGIAWLEGMPRHPGKELAIALAGPAVNVVLAAALGAVLVAGSVLAGTDPVAALLGGGALGWLVAMNVALAVFNLLPIFPTDGGRVLRALLGLATDYRTATRWAGRLGQVAAVGLGLLALVTGQWMAALVMGFLFLMAGQEIARVEYESAPRPTGYPPTGGRPWTPDPTTPHGPTPVRPAGTPFGGYRADPFAGPASEPAAAKRPVVDLIPDGRGGFIVPKAPLESAPIVRWVWTPQGWRPVGA